MPSSRAGASAFFFGSPLFLSQDRLHHPVVVALVDRGVVQGARGRKWLGDGGGRLLLLLVAVVVVGSRRRHRRRSSLGGFQLRLLLGPGFLLLLLEGRRGRSRGRGSSVGVCRGCCGGGVDGVVVVAGSSPSAVVGICRGSSSGGGSGLFFFFFDGDDRCRCTCRLCFHDSSSTNVVFDVQLLSEVVVGQGLVLQRGVSGSQSGGSSSRPGAAVASAGEHECRLKVELGRDGEDRSSSCRCCCRCFRLHLGLDRACSGDRAVDHRVGILLLVVVAVKLQRAPAAVALPQQRPADDSRADRRGDGGVSPLLGGEQQLLLASLLLRGARGEG